MCIYKCNCWPSQSKITNTIITICTEWLLVPLFSRSNVRSDCSAAGPDCHEPPEMGIVCSHKSLSFCHLFRQCFQTKGSCYDHANSVVGAWVDFGKPLLWEQPLWMRSFGSNLSSVLPPPSLSPSQQASALLAYVCWLSGSVSLAIKMTR